MRYGHFLYNTMGIENINDVISNKKITMGPTIVIPIPSKLNPNDPALQTIDHPLSPRAH